MTKEIDLPRGVKSQAVALRIESRRAESWLLLIKVRVGAVQLHVWCVVEFSLHEYRPRRADSVVRGAQIEIGRERAAHQIVEFGIAKLLPPKRLGGMRDECVRLGVLNDRRGDRRRAVVGADRAGGQECRQENRKKVLHSRNFISSCDLNR